MSTTAPLPLAGRAAGGLHALVADYASAVRGELDDLPPDAVDDLTDGLEADLLDALADTPPGAPLPDDGPRPGVGLADTVVAPPVGGTATGGAPALAGGTPSDVPLTRDVLAARFGTPAAYAAELRSSAGLAPRVVAAQGAAARRGARAVWAETRAGWSARWRELRVAPGWNPVFDFLEVLRPAWWVVRAWVLATAGIDAVGASRGFAPVSVGGWFLLLAAVVCSVQWGRGVWRFEPRLRWVGRVLAVAAVVLVLPTTANALGDSSPVGGWDAYDQGVSDATPTDGVWVDGHRAENLYVYGADGKLVDGARVYDDAGKPVLVADPGELGTLNDDDGRGWFEVPSLDRSGRQLWNAYPLERAQIATDEYGNAQYDDQGMPVPQTGVAPTAPIAPFDQVSPLSSRAALPAGEARPGNGATPSPAPSEAPSPGPSPDASPTPQGDASPSATPTTAK